ncbi:SAM-dependent methyltransferase [Streptomyces katrae]|uniref:SAM-dependent methyltransferase n=1 Tax=Streptomyces katrae TaxID=68223 RepID=A0ABT7GVC1_9ACTN|nr:SAM-dependent methyltransferase [Streptomyces katrae]MDK9497189.1 SAM-dependent methyltransferase [Streptomyces katrae]
MDADTFRSLLTDEGQAVLAALGDADPAAWPAALTALRRDHPAELVAAAVEQVRLRREAEAKFGADAQRMYFTPDGLEQASHREVAEYKLGRVLDEMGVVFLDVCPLGVGADALVLGWSHAVTAVDGDPLSVAVTAANAAALDPQATIWVEQQDLTVYEFMGEAVFVDAVRPGEPGPRAWVPSPAWALDTVRGIGAGAVRLGPDLAYGSVPEDCGADEAEWISWEGEVQEAVLWWFGEGSPAARVPRRATLLPGGATLTGRGLPDPAVRPPGRYLYEVDAAVVAAGLVAEVAEDVGGGVLDAAVPARVTSDEARTTPFARAYEITGVLPYDPAAEAAEPGQHAGPGGGGASTVLPARVAGEPALLLVRPAP